MINPFEKSTEKEKYEFFNQMTNAINDWMLKQYPAFDTELVSKIQEIRRLEKEFNRVIEDQKKELNSLKEKHNNFILGQIDEFLSKNYPDISNRLVVKTIELENLIEKHQKNVLKIESRLDKIIKSDMLYEDVYKMRDEFKVMQKFIDEFKKKIKKVFD